MKKTSLTVQLSYGNDVYIVEFRHSSWTVSDERLPMFKNGIHNRIRWIAVIETKDMSDCMQYYWHYFRAILKNIDRFDGEKINHNRFTHMLNDDNSAQQLHFVISSVSRSEYNVWWI